MSFLNNKSRVVQSVLCEIDQLRLGNLDCANNLLQERIEVMDRMWAFQCIKAENDDSYDSLLFYLDQQIKELTLALTIKI